MKIAVLIAFWATFLLPSLAAAESPSPAPPQPSTATSASATRVLRDPTDSAVITSSGVMPIMIKATLRGLICRRGQPGFALIDTPDGLIRVQVDSTFIAGPNALVKVLAITPSEVVIQPLDGGNPLVLR